MPLNSSDREKLLAAATELAERQMMALRLFRPLPHQEPFFKSIASETVVRGGNRSGKSTSAVVRFAAEALGIPVIGLDGKPLPLRSPADEPKLMWCIGYDEKHVGATLYRLLFRPDVFRMIRDQHNGKWRSFHPILDAGREKETKPSPPLIPNKFIDQKGWAWKDKAKRVFSVCRLKDGTEIHAFSSKGEPKQGDAVHGIWIDEDIRFPGHVAEWQARLSDKKGWLQWSAFPHSANFALMNMSQRAKDQKDRAQPDVEEFLLRFSDNPYIDEDEKRKRREGWSEDERRARDDGDFLTDAVLMYPTFSSYVHQTPKREESEDDELDKILRKNGNQPPADWTRYMVLDPGTSTAAVLFGAVPPPELGDHIVVYDELYLKRHDADQLAEKVYHKINNRLIEAFIIDNRAGRQTPAGFNLTIKAQYSQAFAKRGVVSHQTRHGFLNGSDNVGAGCLRVRESMGIRSDGKTKLRVVLANCPNFKREIELYRKRVTKDEVSEEPESGQADHLMDCLRYLVDHNPQWVRRSESMQGSPTYRAWQEILAKQKADKPSFFRMGGPMRSAA